MLSIQLIKYLKSKNLLTQQHQGGISKRGTQLATLNLSMKINQIIESRQMAAVVALDNSAFFDIINHETLMLKLKHIGFNVNAINLIASFFAQRKQYVEVNTQSSDLLVNGNQSIYQGSVLSTLFSNIYLLDLPLITHNIIHTNHIEYYNCNKNFVLNFIDDCFCVLRGSKENIWNNIAVYIKEVTNYYTANKLKLNTNKTQIMITGPNASTGNDVSSWTMK